MKKSRLTEAQIVSILKEADMGMKVDELCKKHGVSSASYYKWKKKYSGAAKSKPVAAATETKTKRSKELEDENIKLKRMYADIALENMALKDIIAKKGS